MGAVSRVNVWGLLAPPRKLTIAPDNPWDARRAALLQRFEARPFLAPFVDRRAIRRAIAESDPVLTLPALEDALQAGRLDRMEALARDPRAGHPRFVSGQRWDRRCGGLLQAPCADVRVVGEERLASFPFEGGRWDAEPRRVPADVTLISVGDQTIPLFTPADYEGTPRNPSRETLLQALAIVPKEVRARITRIVIDTRTPASLPHVLAFVTTERRGVSLVASANWNGTPEQVAYTLIHEVGHVVASSLLGPTDDPTWREWKQARARDNAVVSDYADTDWGEDFAETYSAWVAARGTPFEASVRARFENTFAILDRLFDGPHGV
jgi:hypothetical protein